MAIKYAKNTARFIEIISVEDAEALLEWLQGQKKPRVNLSACTHLHAAVLQVLMAAKPDIVGWPADEHFAQWLRNSLIQGEQ